MQRQLDHKQELLAVDVQFLPGQTVELIGRQHADLAYQSWRKRFI